VSDTLVVAPGAEGLLATLGWTGVEEIFAHTEGEVVAQSRSSDTLRVQAVSGEEVFLKRYRYDRLLLRYLFRPNRALREWRSLHRLRELRFSAPAPLAWGEERRWRRLRRCCLITRGIPGGVNLVEHLQRRGRPDWPVLCRLAEDVARMHEVGYTHLDLFLRNVIVQPGSVELGYLDAARGGRWTGRRAQLHDLASLDLDLAALLSRQRRGVLLRRYWQRRTRGSVPDLPALARQVERARDRLAAIIRRRDERHARRQARLRRDPS
jgi:tRNA A-37 threonylcarbamoyl transferase component Bud32